MAQIGVYFMAAPSETKADPAMTGGVRDGESCVPLPEGYQAQIYFVGRARTPWTERAQCPRRGDPVEGPLCTIEVDPHWSAALSGVASHARLQLLYWMDQARRDLVIQVPNSGKPFGTFALRSPARPNPIASSIVTLVKVEGTVLTVRGLDCVDGTPVVDIKPEHPPA